MRLARRIRVLRSTVRYHPPHRDEPKGRRRTSVFSLGEDVAESLNKVRKVIAEELGTQHDVLAGDRGGEDAAKELRFTL